MDVRTTTKDTRCGIKQPLEFQIPTTDTNAYLHSSPTDSYLHSFPRNAYLHSSSTDTYSHSFP